MIDTKVREYPTSYNTALPAPFLASLVTSPNPWSVTLFAEGRKQCAGPSGSATRNVICNAQRPASEGAIG